MSTVKISRRYAVALFDLIQDGVSLLPAVGEAVELSRCDEARVVFDSPLYPQSVKLAIFDKAVLAEGRDEVMRLASLLISRGKVSLLPEILDQLELMIAEAGSSVDAEVVSAVPLSKRAVLALSKNLESQIGKKVRVIAHEDTSILGGLVIRIGDRKIDCSVKSKLDGMKCAIIG